MRTRDELDPLVPIPQLPGLRHTCLAAPAGSQLVGSSAGDGPAWVGVLAHRRGCPPCAPVHQCPTPPPRPPRGRPRTSARPRAPPNLPSHNPPLNSLAGARLGGVDVPPQVHGDAMNVLELTREGSRAIAEAPEVSAAETVQHLDLRVVLVGGEEERLRGIRREGEGRGRAVNATLPVLGRRVRLPRYRECSA